MFLRAKNRFKDGKKHRYWSIVENRRIQGNQTVQRQVLHLGEINDNQKAAWCKTIDVFQEDKTESKQIAIFPEDRQAPLLECDVVHIRINEIQVHNPRQWGACWLACLLWDQLNFDEFWMEKLPPSRKGTRWLNVFKTLVCYRLIDPGSEWRLHRQWYERSAMADLLGEDFGLVQIDKLYRWDELQILTNFEMDSIDPALFILVGQPHVREKLLRPVHKSINQRIRLKYHITPLSKQMTKEYIEHHLKLCGCDISLFNESATAAIYQNSGGIPRIINSIAHNALNIGVLEKKDMITEEEVYRASKEL